MKPIDRSRSEIIRRYAVFTIALFIMSFGVSLVTRSLLGTSPISSVPYVLSLNTVLTMGTFIIILNALMIAGQMIMLGRNGIRECKTELLMQVPVSLAFGVFVDINMMILARWLPEPYWLQIVSTVAGVAAMALGIALEVIADVSMNSGEYFVHIASRRFKWAFGNVKLMFDITLVVLAIGISWIYAGRIDGVREGTVIAAVLTGPLVKLMMPRLRFVNRYIDGGASTTGANAHIGTIADDSDSTTGAKYPVITIAREFCSGGHDLGRMIAERLAIPFYDNAMMEMVAEESGLTVSTIKNLDQRLPNTMLFEWVLNDTTIPSERQLSSEDALFVAQSKVIRRLAAKGPCVIVGRCADFVLADNPNCLNLFLRASDPYKYNRAVRVEGIDPQIAASYVSRRNAERAQHYAHYTGKRWQDYRNYHMVLDTSKLTSTQIIEAVASAFMSTGNR